MIIDSEQEEGEHERVKEGREGNGEKERRMNWERGRKGERKEEKEINHGFGK